MQSLCSHRARFIYPPAALSHNPSWSTRSTSSPAIRSSLETIVWRRRRGALKDSRTLAFRKILLRIKWQFPMLLESSAQSGSGANHRIIPSNVPSNIGPTSDGTSSNGDRVCNAFMFTAIAAASFISVKRRLKGSAWLILRRIFRRIVISKWQSHFNHTKPPVLLMFLIY